MAKQNDEDKDKGGGGLLGGLKKAPGFAYAKAKQAANAYGVAGTIASTVGRNVHPAIPPFMIAREKWDRHQRGEGIKERTAADPNYNPEADSTLHKVRPAFGSTAVTDAMADLAFSPIDTLKRLLTRDTGREGAKESSELPQVVDDADLGISEGSEGSEGSGNMYEGLGEDQPGANMYEDIEDQAVDYGLTNKSSTDTMGQDMDEGVGSEQKYDHRGFKSEYEGEYDNADAEMRELIENPESRKGFKSAKELRDRRDYLNARLDEATKRKTDSDSAAPGGGQSSTGSSTRTTASRQGYDESNNRGITGALEISAIPQDRAQELQNGRITLRGKSYDVVGNTGDKFLVLSPDQPDYSRTA